MTCSESWDMDFFLLSGGNQDASWNFMYFQVQHAVVWIVNTRTTKNLAQWIVGSYQDQPCIIKHSINFTLFYSLSSRAGLTYATMAALQVWDAGGLLTCLAGTNGRISSWDNGGCLCFLLLPGDHLMLSSYYGQDTWRWNCSYSSTFITCFPPCSMVTTSSPRDLPTESRGCQNAVQCEPKWLSAMKVIEK